MSSLSAARTEFDSNVAWDTGAAEAGGESPAALVTVRSLSGFLLLLELLQLLRQTVRTSQAVQEAYWQEGCSSSMSI